MFRLIRRLNIRFIIVLFSILGLAFLRSPWWVCLAAGAVVVILPQLVQASLFDLPPLLWVGLGATPPVTLDYEPVFPWFGATLVGMGLAKVGLVDRLAFWAADDHLSRALRWAGRHSLAIYLLHQVDLESIHLPKYPNVHTIFPNHRAYHLNQYLH